MGGWQISVHSADVKNVLRVFSIEVAAHEKSDLNEDPIVVRLRKVSPSFSFPLHPVRDQEGSLGCGVDF
jgi:hypothetical protein